MDSSKPSPQDLYRYQDNFLREQDGIALYRALATAERDPARAEIFEKLAQAEERHAARWARLLKTHGAAIPAYTPGWRILLLGWLSRMFGTQHILPVVTGLESRDQDMYRGQVEAHGIPAEERGHMRTLRALQHRGQDRPESILDLEGWHRTIYGGSLVAAGEYVSVQSQRELYEQQIAVERQELEMAPEEEKEELSLIYQAKGIPSAQAEKLAEQILSNPDSAINTLAREELGLDPAALGSPWIAAASSFIAFATGAIIPVVPYLILTGNRAFITSAVVCGAALFVLGGLVSIFTRRNFLFSGSRMLGIGIIAAALTYFIGRILGVSVGT